MKKNWNNPTKSQISSPGSTQSFDTTPNWRMESLIRDSDSDLSNDDEFFDCQGRLCVLIKFRFKKLRLNCS